MGSGGFFGDCVGRLNLLSPMALLSGCLSLLLWQFNNSITTLVVFACVYGFSASSVVILPSAAIGQISPDDRLGARIGSFYSIVAIASLIGSPIGGALITDTKAKEGYRGLIIFSVSMALDICALFYWCDIGWCSYSWIDIHAYKPIIAWQELEKEVMSLEWRLKHQQIHR